MSFRLKNSHFFFCFAVLISLTLVSSSAAARSLLNPTNETDLQALISIRNLIVSDPRGFLASWNTSVHFCRWRGVTCSIRHQRVMALNFSGMELRGTVSPYIGNLTFLRDLKLNSNFFRGVIPQDIGRLYRLQHLSLQNNSFHGEIPNNLTQCSDLRDILLGSNQLQGKIPSELSSLSNLQSLFLSRNELSGSIPSSLGNLSALHNLSLSSNNLEGRIPLEFAKLSKLKTLQLSANRLSGSLPTGIFNISSVQDFDLSFNKFNGSFPWNLGLQLPGLVTFRVAENQFSGPLPASITNATGLQIFDIALNSLSGPVPMNMGNLRELSTLRLSGNTLGSESIRLNFLTSLANCANLTILHLDYNNHTGILPSSIANLTSLISLRLDGNYISGTIPESIGGLTNLQGLFLSKNNFSGSIPSSIGNISFLSVLEMQENVLEGAIPVNLSDCKRLLNLNLSNNRLTGRIPVEILGLSSLSLGLSLANNQLSGPLPLDVGKLRNLENLDVSNNNLYGELPYTLDSCLVLTFLSLQGNNFDGVIPEIFGNLKGLEFLDISSNDLSGEIPFSLAGLSFLEYLNLSFNVLEGEVPDKGIFRKITASSIAGNKKLCVGVRSLHLPECYKERPFSIVGNKKLCGGIEALNLPKCQESPRKHRKLSKPVIIVLAISIPVAVFSIIACAYAVHRIRRPRLPTSTSVRGEQNLKISYAQILHSTNGFSSENLIGEGKYGSVYKGILGHDVRVVAVKVLKLQQRGAHKSFLAECEALRNIRHRNLVKIITSCSSVDFKGNDFKALLFEYVPNGSLDTWLHQNSPEHQDLKKLNLLQRLNIAIDIASALDYLHNHCETQIIHCDLKPSNILIGDDHRALVSDFGLAKILAVADSKSNHKNSSSIGIRGTVGYVAPEYGMGGEVSAKGDIYSYGILLLEMFTGKRPTNSMFTENFSLHSYAKRALPSQVLEIVDPQIFLQEENEQEKISQKRKVRIEECCLLILHIGVSCSSEMQKERMDITDAINELNSIKNKFLQLRNENKKKKN